VRKSVAEILEAASKIPGKIDRISYLRKEYTPTLGKIVQWAYDKRITFLLPEGPVPYKATKALDQEGNLYGEARRLYLFAAVNGQPIHQTLKQVRREALFIQLLENLAPSEAKLVESVKDKKIPYAGLDEEFFKEAFPTLIDESPLL
jgi:hypothetical protein